MTVYNTTYNYNQGNMNFGQAMLYGAFGSLTGGMGMGGCFGGYSSPFSMGGSLFSMMGGCGFGGFGMGYCGDQMVGAQIGLMASQVLVGGISQYIEGRGAAKQEAQEKLSTAKNNVNVLDKEISELETENKGLYTPIGSDGKVTAEAKSACSTEANAYTSAKELLDEEKSKDVNSYTNDTIEGIESKLSELKAKLNATPAPSDAEKTQIQADINEIENPTNGTLIKAKQKAQADAVTARQKVVDSAKLDLETAARTEYNENIKEIESKKKDRAEAQKIIDEAKKAEEHKQLMSDINKADSVASARTRENKLRDSVEVSENDEYTYKNQPELEDIQGALARYRKAKTDSDRKYWAKTLVAMKEADQKNVFTNNYVTLLNRIKQEQNI